MYHGNGAPGPGHYQVTGKGNMAGTTTTKGTTKGNKANKVAPTAPKGDTTPTAPAVTYTKPAPVAPAVRKGTSTVAHPVAHVWVTCLLATSGNGGALLPRKAYMALTYGGGTGGVAYYTARTQVQAYTKWVRGMVATGQYVAPPVPGLTVAPGTPVAPGIVAP